LGVWLLGRELCGAILRGKKDGPGHLEWDLLGREAFEIQQGQDRSR
jgi:hypothetical protein